jgi:hypothetical protein
VAWLAIQSMVRPLVSDPHREIVVNKCASCGQHFVVVFTETEAGDGDDGDDGGDALGWQAVPINDAAFRALGTARRAAVQALVEQLGDGERCLVRHQRGSEHHTSWVDGGFALGPG